MSLYKMVNGVSTPMDSDEEKALLAEWAAWDAEQAATSYQAFRAQAYPPIGDQLDAIWKIIQANPDIVIPVDSAPVLTQINDVKAEFPAITEAPITILG